MWRPDQNRTLLSGALIAGGYLAGIALSTVFSQPAYSQDPKQDLQQIQQQLEGAQKIQESLTFQKDLLNLEIKNLKKELVFTTRRITRVDTALTGIEERLADLTHVEKNTINDLRQRHDELAGTLSAMIRLNRRPDAILLGSSASLIDNLRAGKIMRRLVPYLENESDELSQQLQTLTTLRRKILKNNALSPR